MASTVSGTAFVAPDRGICPECGGSFSLYVMTGMLRAHGDGCPGSGKAPAKVKDTETLELPEPT